jgi:hypothetical protein
VVVARPHDEWEPQRYRTTLEEAARTLDGSLPPPAAHGTGS